MMCFISYIMCAEVIFCHLLILLIWHSKLIKGSYAIDDEIWFSVVNLFFFKFINGFIWQFMLSDSF